MILSIPPIFNSVMPEPAPIFGRSVKPIPTGEGRLSPPITTGTPNVFHLPESLPSNYFKDLIHPKGLL